MLSAKPMVYALNVREGDEAASSASAPLVKSAHTDCVALSAKLEMELSELEPEEAEGFMHELGMDETGTARLLRTCQTLLGLITFFTIGKEEVRAWHIPRGIDAKSAAGTIHSDMEHGFIRAEVIHIDTVRETGAMDAAKAKNLLRLEKKDYIVADGDIIQFRFN
jgi:hypothetical protein